MPQVIITDLPNALALTGTEPVPIVQNGVTVQTTTGAIAGAGALNYPFLTVGATSGLTQARYIAAGSGLSLTDNGIGGSLQINLTGAAQSLDSSASGIQVKTNSNTVVARTFGVGSGLGIVNGDGVAGNPVISLGTTLSNVASLTGTGLVTINGTNFSQVTLATVSGQLVVTNGNASTGSPTFGLATTSVTPGTYSAGNFTVDAYGRLTAASNGSGSSGVTLFSGGTTGLTPNTPTSGSITLAGVLIPLNGGTGASTLTGYVKGNGTFAMTAAATVPTTDLSGTVTNAQIANPSITINGTPVNLGGSTSVGTVTSVTGTAPVVSSGGATPAISMPAATTSVNGYLTSTDWNTFNSKGSGNVTSVAALTLGTTGTDLNSTVANSTTTPVITLNVPTASATNRGALSSVDWTTFNNKQPAGSYVTAISIASSNGFAGTSSGGVTPSLTLTTSVIGLLYGNGTALGAATISAPLAYSAGTLSITQATTSTNGYLSSTDWNTFNNKQPAGAYVTSVSGTTGRITSTGGTTPIIDLVSGIAIAGTTGSATLIPVVTIDTYGRVTSITTAANPQGTVTSVSGAGTVNGLTLTGNVTTSGSLTLGGTLSGVSNSALTNSSITINGSSVSLGGSITVTATASSALTIGTGLTGTSYNGSTPVTIAIDSTVATLTGAQTLTNKSISGSTNTLSNIANASLTNSSVTYNGVAVSLGASGTITASTTNALTIGTGLSGTSFNGGSAVTIAISNTGVSAGTYGSATSIPSIQVNAQGQITSITTNALNSPAYQGTWNASTNTPTLVSSVGTNNNYYIVSTAGTTNLNGISLWSVGDWAIFNSTTSAWEKVLGGSAESFTSIAVTGLTGYMYANGTSNVTASTTIPNAGLANSSITINGSSVSLGGSVTVTATASSALTIGTGLSGTSYNGSTAVTIDNTGVLSVSGGTTGLTPSTATSGAVTLAGTLVIGNGGTGASTASGARTNLGLGTIATQDANNVAITGGAINSTTVGATTASTGAFTTLSASSTVSGTGFSTYLASPPAIGGTTASTGRFTTITSTVATGTAPFTVASTTAVANLSIGGNAGTVTNGVYTTDTGTVTNTMLAGSIANAKLTNSSITFGSTAQALGSTVSAISGVTIDNGAIGGTTAAAGTFTTLIGGSGSANYEQITGGATTKAVQFQTLGTDTNISVAVQPKGTGAIDLAAGSSGVNISNGGTVTALTRSAVGGSYTSNPTLAISAPTTAGGIQATATCTVMQGTITIAGGGTGYTAGDVLTFVGGTGSATIVTVSTVSSGVITAVTNNQFGAYSVVPANPISVTGGTGTGATFNSNWVLQNSFTITNAGSGYVEQPTVTFSGGGGSGAAAYATVGSQTIIRSLGAQVSFYTPNGEGFRVQDGGTTSSAYWIAFGTSATPSLRAVSGTSGSIETASAVPITFKTSTTLEQLRVSHTASAVNYVQVTGAATNNSVAVSSQGSDGNVSLNLITKGTGVIRFYTAAASSEQFRVTHTAGTIVNYATATGAIAGAGAIFGVAGTDTNIDLALVTKGTGSTTFTVNAVQRASIRGSDGYALLGLNATGTQSLAVAPNGSAVNYLQVISGLTGAAPVLSSLGSDTNIDLSLTPKGTGVIQFGTYTATVTAVAGYILIKDAGGTTRKLAVLT